MKVRFIRRILFFFCGGSFSACLNSSASFFIACFWLCACTRAVTISALALASCKTFSAKTAEISYFSIDERFWREVSVVAVLVGVIEVPALT